MNRTDFRILKAAVIAALAYPLTFLTLYFTLLIHLRLGLGRWPVHISDNLSTPLFHAHEVAAGLFFMLGVVLVPVSSVIAVAFAVAPRSRRVAAGLAIFSVGGLLAYGAMQLAPHSFLAWWWG